MESVVLCAVAWPMKGGGYSSQIVAHFENLLCDVESIAKTEFYSPSRFVWEKLIKKLATIAGQSPTAWKTVSRGCHSMLELGSKRPTKSGRQTMMHIGCDAAEHTRDPQLAVDVLVSASLRDHDESFKNERSYYAARNSLERNKINKRNFREEKMSFSVMNVPVRSVARVLGICIVNARLDLAKELLKWCHQTSYRIPDAVRTQLWTEVVAGHAQYGDFAGAQEMLRKMQESGPAPRCVLCTDRSCDQKFTIEIESSPSLCSFLLCSIFTS